MQNFDMFIICCLYLGVSLLVHHLFNKKDSLVGTKSLVHFFKDGGLSILKNYVGPGTLVAKQQSTRFSSILL